jgi:hypothetical protein
MGPFADGWKHEDVDAVLVRADPAEVLYVPIVVGMNAQEAGCEWAQTICHRLTSHAAAQVRANAILGLGHIARTCRQLNLELAIPAIERGLRDETFAVRQNAREVTAELQVFLGTHFNQHPLSANLLRSTLAPDAPPAQ